MPPKILISGGLAAGGLQTHIKLICELLIRNGASVTVAATSTNWPELEFQALKELGVNILASGWGFGRLAFVGKAQAMLVWPLKLSRDFDLVYCVGSGRAHHLARRHVKKGGRVVYHEVVSNPADGIEKTRLLAYVDEVVANSTRVADQFAALPGSYPVTVLPFMIEDTRRSLEEVRPPVGARVLRFVYLGRLVRHKRIDWLIQSWARVLAACGPCRLDVYGGDYANEPLLEGLRRDVDRLELQPHITLHGSYDSKRDLDKILISADAVLLPSLDEGLPLVLTETMLRGVPFVATSAGGTADLGLDNPDVCVTELDPEDFLRGVSLMATRLRSGDIDSKRLSNWARLNYSLSVTSKRWEKYLLGPGPRTQAAEACDAQRQGR